MMVVLREPFSARSWAEFGFALIALPLGVVGFLFSILSLGAAAVLMTTLVGLPLLALAVRGGRRLGALHRAVAHRLLGVVVAAPARAQPRGSGVLHRLTSGLSDAGGWRAHGYLLLRLPLAVTAFIAAVVLRLGGVLLLFAPFLQNPETPHAAPDSSGFVPHAFEIRYGDFHFDSWPKMALLAAQGVVMILLAPWVLRPVLALDAFLTSWLLGPSALTERVHDLERSRAAVVDDAAARLRGIERDLHDGAQAQLVAVAMKLSLASEKLAGEPVDVGRIRQLVDTALDTARSAITDLRDLVSGIHPPILDEGLEAALATLIARSTVPATLAVELPRRPAPAVESIVYFCAAELLTNVAKHSGASTASVKLTGTGDRLRLRVRDDGAGGAVIRAGSGLAGLVERVRVVDGSLSVASSAGGPTTVTITLPITVGGGLGCGS